MRCLAVDGRGTTTCCEWAVAALTLSVHHGVCTTNEVGAKEGKPKMKRGSNDAGQ